MEHIGTIKSAGKQATKEGGGTTFVMTLENPKWTYYLFDPKLQKVAEENIGKRVKVEYNMSQDEKFRNVESIEPALEAEPTKSNGMSKEEWAIKDRIATRRAIANTLAAIGSFTEVEADRIFAWVMEEKPKERPSRSTPSEAATELSPTRTFRNVGELLAQCNACGVSRQEVFKFLKVTGPLVIKPDEAWPRILEMLIKPRFQDK